MSLDIDYLENRLKEIRKIINEIGKMVSKPFNHLSIDERYAIRYQILFWLKHWEACVYI